MKNICILKLSACLIIFCSSLQAQDNLNSKKVVLKLYYNGQYKYSESDDYNGYVVPGNSFLEKNKSYDFGGISIAIEFNKDKFFTQEYELMPIIIRDNDVQGTISDSLSNVIIITGGDKTTFIESAFRYQLTHYFLNDKRVLPSIGLSPQVFYNYNRYAPYIAGKYFMTEHVVGLNISIIPGLTIKLSKKLSIDLDIPIGLYEIKYNSVYIKNPNLPIQDQKVSEINGTFIPKKVNVRFGILYNI